MFDTTPAPTVMKPETDPRPWPETVTAGDILSFRFPRDDDTGETRPKARPCLVLAVAMIDGQRRMSVAYGTSVLKKARNAHGILLTAGEASVSGLARATGFCGDRVRTITTGDPALAVSPVVRTPIIGRLSGRPLERMRRVQIRLYAGASGTIR